MNDEHIIIFDGICNLCSASVNLIIERETRTKFKFVSMQSNTGLSLLKKNNINSVNNESIILIKQNRVFSKSDTALEITRELDGLWPLLYIFRVIPGFLRDFLYTFIANNRYSRFGKKEACFMPTEELKNRFLD